MVGTMFARFNNGKEDQKCIPVKRGKITIDEQMNEASLMKLIAGRQISQQQQSLASSCNVLLDSLLQSSFGGSHRIMFS